jgi:hypothetical protein
VIIASSLYIGYRERVRYRAKLKQSRLDHGPAAPPA